ncbi:DUF3347 domain-containing protein [Pedobacter sp. L105]|uniref:DUF3347 domain-containing protein n=1 Tax=Pedobacter sp. L105 TaxID=1641871 RepID=UPI00131B38CC|nr:DUF3347 domain-containing protein [Pedobacter sp. L105]
MKKFLSGICILILLFTVCAHGAIKIEATENSKPSPLKGILSTYLEIKNAFVKNDDIAAAAAGKEMVKAFTAFNKSSLTSAQAKTYSSIEAQAKENAEHIGKSVGNIDHQREHFEALSKEVYAMVKLIGAGQKLYYDNCPMYNNNKGAQWLSEVKGIQNPYLGKSMPDCGSVKEELN